MLKAMWAQHMGILRGRILVSDLDIILVMFWQRMSLFCSLFLKICLRQKLKSFVSMSLTKEIIQQRNLEYVIWLLVVTLSRSTIKMEQVEQGKKAKFTVWLRKEEPDTVLLEECSVLKY